MGKSKTGGHSQVTMESCDEECPARQNCIEIKNILQGRSGIAFRCPIQNKR